MPKVSVIVPVYNAEKYLQECVDSILRQTLTDLELIIVDDGSTDTSPALCDRYAEQDARVKVIHKPNGRAASARNAGIHVYPADYFNPMDSATGKLTKTENTYSIHWYSMSWMPQRKQIRAKIGRVIRRIRKELRR